MRSLESTLVASSAMTVATLSAPTGRSALNQLLKARHVERACNFPANWQPRSGQTYPNDWQRSTKWRCRNYPSAEVWMATIDGVEHLHAGKMAVVVSDDGVFVSPVRQTPDAVEGSAVTLQRTSAQDTTVELAATNRRLNLIQDCPWTGQAMIDPC